MKRSSPTTSRKDTPSRCLRNCSTAMPSATSALRHRRPRMMERVEEIATASGTMPTFTVHPSDGGPFPAVIIYMDIWGIREELLDIARQTAACGYCCMLPDLFYREGVVRNEFRDANGRMITLEKLTDAQKEKVRGPLRRLSDSMVMDDTDALLRNLEGMRASLGKVTAVGYCMG